MGRPVLCTIFSPLFPLLALLLFAFVALPSFKTLVNHLKPPPSSSWTPTLSLTSNVHYNEHFPPISKNGSAARVLEEIQQQLRQSLTVFTNRKQYEQIVTKSFRPLRVISVQPLDNFGYVHSDEIVRPICFNNDFGRVPSSAPNAKPLCLNVFQNAYLGARGIVTEPLTKYVYEIAGGCCTQGWKDRSGIVNFRGATLDSVSRFKGKIVLSLGHHHSVSNHHVLAEVMPKFMLVAPLLEARPDIYVAIDKSDITWKLLTMLGVHERRILQFPITSRPEWRFASLVLSPVVLPVHNHLNYYPTAIEKDVAGLLADIALTGAEEDRKPVMVVLERGTKRDQRGRCTESRCLSNFAQVLRAVREKFGERYNIIIFRATDGVTVAIPLFARASVVLGVHGGGFQNIMFCRKGTTVLHIGWGLEYKALADNFDINYHPIFVPNLTRETRGYVIRDVPRLLANVTRAIEEDIRIKNERLTAS